MNGKLTSKECPTNWVTPYWIIECDEFMRGKYRERRDAFAMMLRMLQDLIAKNDDGTVYPFPFHIMEFEQRLMQRLDYLCENISHDEYKLYAGYKKNFKNGAYCPHIALICESDKMFGEFSMYPVLSTSVSDDGRKIDISISSKPRKAD